MTINEQQAIAAAERLMQHRIPREHFVVATRFRPARFQAGMRFDACWMVSFQWIPSWDDEEYEKQARVLNPLPRTVIIKVDSETGEAEMLPF